MPCSFAGSSAKVNWDQSPHRGGANGVPPISDSNLNETTQPKIV